MRKLLINFFVFSLPLLICLLFFIADDPFGIFYKDKCLAEASDDVVKTRNYLHNYSEQKYTSFIFGNSRAHGFLESDWQKNIGNERIYQFSSPGESVLNIKKKIELISKHQQIKNALIIIDAGILENTNNQHRFYKGPVYEHSPLTSNSSYFNFFSNYIKYYFDDFFFVKHIYYKLTSSYKKEWMNDSFKDPSEGKSNEINSFKYETLADSLINTNFVSYKSIYKPDYSAFKRKQSSVNAEDSVHLTKIKKILDSHAVNYKFIIPPDFQGKKIAPKIYNTLYSILGNKLYDFTGINKISTDSTLNYENLHFTSRAGAIILDSIYKTN